MFAKYKSHGFVLPAVLCLLMLMTLLTLVSYEYTKVQYQIAYIFMLHKEQHVSLLFQLTKVEQKFNLDYDTCVRPTKIGLRYAHETNSWWQKNACLISKQPFDIYYVNEKIAPTVCELQDDGKLTGLAIHRLTLVLLTGRGNLFLQTVELARQVNKQPCLRVLKVNKFGRQNLRWG